jgi:ABC-2 type transport system permease protein
MRNMFIIARREYLERVRSKAFIVMTILIPVLMLGATVLPTLLMLRGSGETKHIAVVASSQATGELLRDQLNKASEQRAKDVTTNTGMNRRNQENFTYQIDIITDTSQSQHDALAEKVKQKQLAGAIFATDDALAARKVSFITRDISNFSTIEDVRSAITQTTRRSFLTSKGLTQDDIEATFKPVELDSKAPGGSGNPFAVFFTAFAMVMIMYITVLMYGINVMEVMLASARPMEMMGGKIIGVGAVGLTQIAIWAATAASFVYLKGTGSGLSLGSVMSAKVLMFFCVFFLLGYVLYSTLCAAIGAMVNSDQEAQQLQFIIMAPLIVSIIMMGSIIQSPNGPTAVWGSLFPLTAPLIMFLRISIEMPPWWQIWLSIGLMMLTAYLLVFLCARIYRVGVLMYGKRPTLPEIVKWIKYA